MKLEEVFARARIRGCTPSRAISRAFVFCETVCLYDVQTRRRECLSEQRFEGRGYATRFMQTRIHSNDEEM